MFACLVIHHSAYNMHSSCWTTLDFTKASKKAVHCSFTCTAPTLTIWSQSYFHFPSSKSILKPFFNWKRRCLNVVIIIIIYRLYGWRELDYFKHQNCTFPSLFTKHGITLQFIALWGDWEAFRFLSVSVIAPLSTFLTIHYLYRGGSMLFFLYQWW